jgi:hypothetical protein
MFGSTPILTIDAALVLGKTTSLPVGEFRIFRALLTLSFFMARIVGNFGNIAANSDFSPRK